MGRAQSHMHRRKDAHSSRAALNNAWPGPLLVQDRAATLSLANRRDSVLLQRV